MAASSGAGLMLKRLGIVLALVTALGVGTALLVVTAFGIGKLLSFLLPLSVFECSLLSMLGMLALLAAAWRLIENLSRAVGPEVGVAEDDEEEAEVVDAVVEAVARNARCPCGSRRKFKNCCGRRGVTAFRAPW